MKDKLEFNEENQINLVVEKDGLKREMFYQGKPIQELIKYTDMWQRLKEWLSFTQPKNINDEFISGACVAYEKVIDKMQELEGEDE